MTTCTKCKETKEDSGFSKRSDKKNGLDSWCRTCRAYLSRQWRKKNPEKMPAYDRALHLKKKYGITEDEYQSMLSVQDGVCAICDGVNTQRKFDRPLAVDHSHTTGEVRGLLCDQCNQALGGFRDSRKLLVRAVGYLQ